MTVEVLGPPVLSVAAGHSKSACIWALLALADVTALGFSAQSTGHAATPSKTPECSSSAPRMSIRLSYQSDLKLRAIGAQLTVDELALRGANLCRAAR